MQGVRKHLPGLVDFPLQKHHMALSGDIISNILGGWQPSIIRVHFIREDIAQETMIASFRALITHLLRGGEYMSTWRVACLQDSSLLSGVWYHCLYNCICEVFVSMRTYPSAEAMLRREHRDARMCHGAAPPRYVYYWDGAEIGRLALDTGAVPDAPTAAPDALVAAPGEDLSYVRACMSNTDAALALVRNRARRAKGLLPIPYYIRLAPGQSDDAVPIPPIDVLARALLALPPSEMAEHLVLGNHGRGAEFGNTHSTAVKQVVECASDLGGALTDIQTDIAIASLTEEQVVEQLTNALADLPREQGLLPIVFRRGDGAQPLSGRG